MHTHDLAEHPIERHPVILDLEQRLKALKFPEAAIRFLRKHILFAYPRTLWVRWSVDVREPGAAEEIGGRQSLDPEKTGKFLSEWLKEKHEIKNIIFDLTGVTIFDSEKLAGLFAATTADADGAKYYVCSGEIARALEGMPGVDRGAIKSSEKAMIALLRDVPTSQRCIVPLPASVDLLSLDRAFRKHASDKKIRNCDVVALDFRAVTQISFDAHCMLAPIIHALGHRYGILATVCNAKKRIVNDLRKHGSLRPMRSHLIQTPQDHLWRDEPTTGLAKPGRPGPMALHTFTYFERDEIYKFWANFLEEMIRFYDAWFAVVGGIRKGLGQEQADRMVDAKNWLKGMIKELVDNVAYHAGTVEGNGATRSIALGYIAMELDPRPSLGLQIYVGDTGIGLAKGLAASYEMTPPTDREAVAMALNLGEKLDDRKESQDGYGGRGLEHARLMLSRLKGRISIRSRGAMSKFAPAKGRAALKLQSNLYDVQGTHIQIRIPSKWRPL